MASSEHVNETILSVEILKPLQEFEAFLQAALAQKYVDLPKEFTEYALKANPIGKWDLIAFCDNYLGSSRYPPERLKGIVSYLMDVKIQFYFLLEVDCGLYNSLVYNRGYDHSEPRAKPHLQLTRLSLDQTLILKSRVLWERIMNTIYYLETGEELEGRKSKRGAFFKHILKDDRWRFLEPYGPMIEAYDNAYRTPEAHKHSVLRPEVLGRSAIASDKLLQLLNSAMNALWENMIEVIAGGYPTHYTWLHLDASGRLDSRYQIGQTREPTK